MTIDKRTLDLARQWADGTYTPAGGELIPETTAAVKVLQSLPDQWVDAEKVRNLAESMLSSFEGMPVDGSDAAYDASTKRWWREVSALLPAPTPAVVVRMGAWAMHPKHGKVMIASAKPDSDGEVLIAWDGHGYTTGTAWVKHADLSPLPDGKNTEPDDEDDLYHPHIHWALASPPDQQEDLIYDGGSYGTPPSTDPIHPQDEPPFDPAHQYLDKKGERWIYNRWYFMWMPAGVANAFYDTPPTEFGPYTRIDKENDQ